MANRFQAEPLLVAPGQISWVETNLRADPSQLLESLLDRPRSAEAVNRHDVAARSY